MADEVAIDHEKQQQGAVSRELLEKRPGVLIVGSSTVGKRTLLSRLLTLDFDDVFDSSSDILPYGWTIDTKYYTADVCLWMANLHEEFSISSFPISEQLAALVMVFDMNDLTSFLELKEWISRTDIRKFDILLCIGNKADLLPGHPAHTEYRRRLTKVNESSVEVGYGVDYGISESEGSSLLGGDEEPSWEIKRSCMDWCIDHGIEYIEACASNADFDKCLSIDGDSQGVDRLFGALSAHMWPGMVLKKSGDKIKEPSLPEQEELSEEEESDFELEYERLSEGMGDPWGDDDTESTWISANGPVGDSGPTLEKTIVVEEGESQTSASTSTSQLQGDINLEEMVKVDEDATFELDKEDDPLFKFEDMEQLMSEIGGMRDSLRLLQDFQRREMAAKLAMKMATMFGDVSEDDDDNTVEHG